MDGIGGIYQDPEQLQALVHRKGDEEAKLKEIGVQFESILLRDYLKTALRPMFEGHMGGNSMAGAHFYEGMMVDRMADNLSRTGQLGLSNLFLEQLKDIVPAEKSAPPDLSVANAREHLARKGDDGV